MPDIKEILETEFSPEFIKGMQNRMIVSFFKYGFVRDAVGCDHMASLRKRISKYEETGNTEWLVDVANFAMMEFMFPKHKSAHFRGTDAAESPGRARANGEFDANPNVPPDLAVERLRDRMGREGD